MHPKTESRASGWTQEPKVAKGTASLLGFVVLHPEGPSPWSNWGLQDDLWPHGYLGKKAVEAVREPSTDHWLVPPRGKLVSWPAEQCTGWQP